MPLSESWQHFSEWSIPVFQAELEVSSQPLRSSHRREAEGRTEADGQRVVQPEVRSPEGQRLEGNYPFLSLVHWFTIAGNPHLLSGEVSHSADLVLNDFRKWKKMLHVEKQLIPHR